MREALRLAEREARRGSKERNPIATSHDHDIVVVDHFEGLDDVARALDTADRIAIDTESNSLHVYRETVCYVQICTGTKVFLIDTIAVRDLSPLAPAFTDPEKLKILHGADYDVVCIKRDFDIGLDPIFDTMVAAQMLGYDKLGLAALVERHFGALLDKSLSKHDWGRRPLEERYVPYLIDDVIYLEDLHDILDRDLEEEDFIEEAELEFERVARQEWSGTEEVDPDRFRKIKGARDLDHLGLATLSGLYLLRDRFAREANLPPFRILGNEQLLNAARRRPRNLRDLKSIRGFTDRVLRKIGHEVIETIKTANTDDVPVRPPRKPRPPEVQVAIDEGLRAWRRDVCEESGLHSLVVLPNHVIDRISVARPSDLDELAGIEGLGNKRLERYGNAILDVVDAPPPVRFRRR